MTNIKTNEILAFWPTSICPSFFDTPGNTIISGNCNFSFDLDFKINLVSENSGERGTIVSINPNHFVLHYYNEDLSAIHMATNGNETHNIHQDIPNLIKLNKVHRLKVVNVDSSEFKVYIDDVKVLSTNNFNITKDPQILFGSVTFSIETPEINSCDIDLYSFRLFHNDVLISKHDFNKIIHNKFVDLTNNCNFIHKL
jgi:hypothetical protein